MNFIANILPTNIERYIISNGNIDADGIITINPGGSVSVALDAYDITYIPLAFQMRVIHNQPTIWKAPTNIAHLYILYDDGQRADVGFPFTNEGEYAISQWLTLTVALTRSSSYTSMSFTIDNPFSTPLILYSYELRPAVDEGLEETIKALLPNIVYQYNDSLINSPSGTKTAILTLSVTNNTLTDLLCWISITGSLPILPVTDSILQVDLEFDGEQVKTFPQTALLNHGSFYMGIPTVIPGILPGTHTATVFVQGDSSNVVIPVDSALITIEGKGVVGLTAEGDQYIFQSQYIPANDFDKFGTLDTAVNIIQDQYIKLSESVSDSIPVDGFDKFGTLNDSATVELDIELE